VLFRSSHKHWIATSAHCLTGDDPLWLPGVPSFHELPGPIIQSPEVLDLAYAELSGGAVEALERNGHSFLDHDKISLAKIDPKAVRCSISGYPEPSVEIHEDKGEVIVDPFIITTCFFSENEQTGLGENRHVQIAAKLDGCRGPNGERLSKFPWRGLSGGAIWSIVPDKGPRLVGIVTMHDPSRRALIGTRIGPLIREIAHRLSAELSPAIVLPKGYIDHNPQKAPWYPIGEVPPDELVEILLPNGLECEARLGLDGWSSGSGILNPIAWRRRQV